MSPTLAARTIVIAAFQMAVRSRPIHPSELIFHSDRGVQYACDDFRKLFKALKIFQSMSRKGNCWDNSVAENFIKSIKSEFIYQISELNVGQARTEIYEFIEIRYSRKRKYSYLNDQTHEYFGKIKQSLVA